MNELSTTEAVLRDLARRAAGLTGADVEKLIRVASQSARRARRDLTYGDLIGSLGRTKSRPPEHVRRRFAVHEAGHLVAHIRLNVGRITGVSIDTPTGDGWVRFEQLPEQELTEHFLSKMLVVRLAGRVAEQEFIGNAIAGSGGGEQSDLALATRLAVDLETKFGFGDDLSLVYLDIKDISWSLLAHKDIARRVNSRLYDAEVEARHLISCNKAEIEFVSNALLAYGTLEGESLNALLQELKSCASRSQ